MREITTSSNQPQPFPLPVFPEQRITKLWLDLKASLWRSGGQPVSFEDWGKITGRPGNTIAAWSAGGAAHQIQVLLASLERLTGAQRHKLIDAACREYPTLDHPKLAHDFVACSRLGTLLRQSSGLTFIQGPEHMRTFLLSALGHSGASLDPKGAPVTGVDIHRSDHFVPVAGLKYLDNLLRATEIQREFKRAWPAVCAAKAWLILLNGVWQNAPTSHSEIREAARKSHVVVADGSAPKAVDLTRGGLTPAHLVTVSPAREQPQWIRIEIQAL
jgi:hypothetical protein